MNVSRPVPTEVGVVTCIGTGVIGGGWVAHFLARGFEVRAWDPAPRFADRLQRLVDNAWPTLTELGLAPGAKVENLRICDTPEQALDGTQFVQESGPEDLELKRKLLAQIDAATDEQVVISSSTSGYSMTEMATEAVHPERLVVGHPFNPPYLLPLVEVVGGEKTSADVLGWTSDFFTAAGKSVILMDQEVPGFIANRLQEALWREALHMIAAGEATPEQIDRAVIDGPGLRWAFHGPVTTFHLAGGEGGMEHALDHFGPSLDSPWSRLASPALDESLRRALVDGISNITNDTPVADLVRQRDRNVVRILAAIRDRAGQ